MKYLSICSGIEAATQAWHPLGWQPLAFSEIDAFPRAVLAHHYPTVPLHGDFTALKNEQWIADADVLVGGTPCQAFSVAGLRNSLADERGNLSLEFVRLADAIDNFRLFDKRPPCVIVWENVPGVLSVKDNAFGCFLAALAGDDTPYIPPRGKWTNAGVVAGPKRTIAWIIKDAQYFGVAQRRRRLFVVASAGEKFDPAAVLLECEGVRRDFAPRRKTGQAIANCLGASPAGNGSSPNVGNGQGNVVAVDTYNGSISEMAPTLCTQGDHASGNAAVFQPMTTKQWPVDVAPTLNASFGDKQGLEDQHALGGAGLFVPMAVACEVADTLSVGANQTTGFHGDMAAVGMQVRRLTPVECERLQGFPDTYTQIPWRNKPAEECPDGPRYKALGNSMAVPVMHWIGQRIQNAVISHA